MVPGDHGISAAGVRLEQIQAVTDAALAHLSVEDLLDALLDRVRDVLETDTAAVLVLDRATDQLVATAAKGLEDEVRQGTRVAVGEGFAGQVAATRQPVIIDDVDSTKGLNPVLVQKGVRSLLGVPLIAGGELFGVLHIGTLTPRQFTRSDGQLLRMVADRVALAVRSLLSQSERMAARELQRSLLPRTLPTVPGVELAARYVPGESSVSGDWYDVFTLPSDELCVVMGDVTGHGLRAASIMGRIRSTLRANAFECRDPAKALTRLDRQMDHFEPDVVATVLFAVCHPELEWVHISSAGHLPPILISPGHRPALLDLPRDVPIGVDCALPRRSTTVKIPKGALLSFYTDGLVERRHDTSIDVGLGRLCKALHLGHPEVVCAVVMAELIGPDPAEDDVALLLLSRTSD
jgi:phosphoserine phosphatase RsbU/P